MHFPYQVVHIICFIFLSYIASAIPVANLVPLLCFFHSDITILNISLSQSCFKFFTFLLSPPPFFLPCCTTYFILPYNFFCHSRCKFSPPLLCLNLSLSKSCFTGFFFFFSPLLSSSLFSYEVLHRPTCFIFLSQFLLPFLVSI